MGKKYILQHDRPNCIGCGACAVVANKFWQMADDGKSDIIGGSPKPNGWQEMEIDEKDYEANHEAATSCPVEVIHLVEKDTKKKII
ncbi:MAG: ferredoxin [Nanoarchaeota archaeon]|nr:ferredoxin [Nanoarchaeota archaeon]